VLIRTLPGILQSGLWRGLDELPPAPTLGLITDVGNDILYGFSAAQTMTWVEEAADRLEHHASRIVVAGLPTLSVRRLSRARFLLFRSILVPQCRLSLAQVVDASEEVESRLAGLAAARRFRFVRLKDEWYGVDPVHIRPGLWRRAWQEILLGETDAATPHNSWIEGVRLFLKPPQRQWFLGRECITPQTGQVLGCGGRIWLY
jgi:hypothetical protein